MTAVTFVREQKDGLLFSAIYVEDQLLRFENDRAVADLTIGKQYDIYWRIAGPTGSSLAVSKSVGDAAPIAIVNSAIRASDKGRRRDFRLFTA
jgi:hypothetical protein